MIVLHPGSRDLRFPPVESATPEGLLAVGGDLSSARLVEAYRHGIFPWYNPGEPILWWSPDPRAVLYPPKLKISRSLHKTLRRGQFQVTFDNTFREVMLACAAPRAQYPGGGTWITDDMVAAYCALHEQGIAHSVEVWHERQLAGGLYGVALGRVFFGESMFTRITDASKVALAVLARSLHARQFALIDCQLPSAHLNSLGAESVPRARFLSELDAALKLPGWPGHWTNTLTTESLAP
jgi:leucyl/phenylalanyl-tRNA--protein transferase